MTDNIVTRMVRTRYPRAVDFDAKRLGVNAEGLLIGATETASQAVAQVIEYLFDVPHAVYMDAILGVYEMNKVDLLRDVFIWEYEGSTARYATVRQSLGEPDPFRFKHKAGLRRIVGEVVRGRMDRKEAAGYITTWVGKNGMAFRKPSGRNSGTRRGGTREPSRRKLRHGTRSGPPNSRHGNRSGASAKSHERQTAARPHPLPFDYEPARKNYCGRAPWLGLKRGDVRVASRRNGNQPRDE